MIAEIDQVLTPEELLVFEQLAMKGIKIAHSLQRQDKVKSISELLEQTRIETREIYFEREAL